MLCIYASPAGFGPATSWFPACLAAPSPGFEPGILGPKPSVISVSLRGQVRRAGKPSALSVELRGHSSRSNMSTLICFQIKRKWLSIIFDFDKLRSGIFLKNMKPLRLWSGWLDLLLSPMNTPGRTFTPLDINALTRTRTRNLQLRRLSLCPVEL